MNIENRHLCPNHFPDVVSRSIESIKLLLSTIYLKMADDQVIVTLAFNPSNGISSHDPEIFRISRS